MTENSAQPDQFTGLILLTGSDRPGIAASLFETLSPFAVHVLDIEQVVINNRLILTVLIGASAAHQGAIEEDLNTCALNLDVDIATLFGKGPLAPLPHHLLEVHLSAEKLHPSSVALVSHVISNSGANIERFVRIASYPISIIITISSAKKTEIDAAFDSLVFEHATIVSTKAL
jgi:phosphoserine phosphatase